MISLGDLNDLLFVISSLLAQQRRAAAIEADVAKSHRRQRCQMICVLFGNKNVGGKTRITIVSSADVLCANICYGLEFEG